MDTRPSELAERAAEAIERQDRLRPVEDALQRAIAALFRSGGAAGGVAKNALHGTWLGHPLHPVLTDVPLGAWTVALVLDGLEAHAGERRWGRAAEGAVGIGIAGALAAALAG